MLDGQSSRGQLTKLSDVEFRARYPDLVVASLGAIRKDKPIGVVTARVLFEGTRGIPVNTRTRIRDHERAPVASDLNRIMKEEARVEKGTFSLTADVADAHRPTQLASLGMSNGDWRCTSTTVGTFGVAFASYSCSCVAKAIGRMTRKNVWTREATWSRGSTSSTARTSQAFQSTERPGSSNGSDKCRTPRGSTLPLLRRGSSV